jgi:transcription initiation factor TFIID subunit 2
MGAKLQTGVYQDRFAFEADFALMIDNAKKYNVPGSFAHNEAIILRTHFDKQWARINKTVEAADKASQVRAVEDAASTSAKAMPPPPPPPLASSRNPPPAEGPSTSSRPMIKLKPSGSINTTPNVPEAPKAKPKTRKPKVVDVPPPPYIDDGSHDLLQEVIAMEK